MGVALFDFVLQSAVLLLFIVFSGHGFHLPDLLLYPLAIAALIVFTTAITLWVSAMNVRYRDVPVPLVLHGSSGVADEDLRRAVSAGITKINVGTLLNVRFTAAVREHLTSDESVTDPRKYLAPARTAIADAVAAVLEAIA